MSDTVLILSIEEVAYAMGVLGGSETATGFLLGILGQRPRLEVEGRLVAAAHSLVARGYLEFDAGANSSWLVEPLQSIIKPLVQSDYSLRLSRVQNGQEVVATLYVSTFGIVLHQLHKNVASRLQGMSDFDQARQACWNFIGLVNTSGETSEALAIIPGDLLDSLRRESTNQTVADTATQLSAYGLGMDSATHLAQDLHSERSRSSIVRLGVEGDEVVARRGFLVLQGYQRNWLFDIDPTDSARLYVFPGTLAVFQRLFASLHS